MAHSVKTSEIVIPDDVVAKWQSALNILAKVVQVPAALIMKVEPPFIEVFRSSESSGNPYRVGDRELLAGLYCERVITSRKKLLVPNALKDPDWDKNPDIKLGMISYLGLPLLWPNGEVFGTICVLDSKENRYQAEYESLLRQFKRLVEAHLSLLFEKHKLELTVAERAQAEQALRESEERFRLLSSAAFEGIAIHDKGLIIDANEAFAAMLGYELAEVIGMHVLDFATPETRDLVQENILSGCEQPHETIGLRKDGSTFIGEVRSKEIPYKGRTVHVAIVRDITERKRIEQALRESEEKFRLAFYTSPDAISITRLQDGQFVEINEGFTAITGYRREDVIGKIPEELNIWDHSRDHQRLVRRLREDGFVSNLEARFRMKDGRVVTGLLSARVIMIGEVPHILSLIRSIEDLKQAERALHHHAERLRTLREIDQAILEAQSPEAVAQAALRHIRRLVPCARVSVMMMDLELKEAMVLASHVSGETLLGHGRRFPIEDEMMQMLRSGEVHVVTDIRGLDRLSAEDRILLEEGIRSYLNVPFLIQSELIGTLNIGSDEPDAFDDEHIEIAREVARPLAIAIQQARLYEEVQRHAERMASVVHVGQALGTTLDLQEICRIAHQEISVLVDCPNFGLFTYDETAELIHPLYLIGDGKPLAVENLPAIPYEPESGLQSRAIATRQPVIVADVQAQRDRLQTYRNIPTEERKLPRSLLIVPLVVEEQVIGTLQLQSYQVGLYTGGDAQLLSGIGNQLALAIQNARLYAETRRRAEESSALLATARAITSLDLATVLNTVAAQVKKLFQADGSRIHLLDPDGETLRCVVALHQRADQALAFTLKLGEGITGRVALHGEAEIVDDARAHPLAVQMPGTPVEDEVLALAPLKMQDHVIGVLTVSRLGLERPFSPEDLDLLSAFANQATLSIHNARLYEQVQRHAEELEERVAERTAELQEHVAHIEQLNRALANLLEDVQAANRQTERTAQRLAKANEELESFAHSVAHDLRAPLRAMQGFSEALLQDYGNVLDEVGQDYARRIVNAGRRMDLLIDDLLAYSRLGRAEIRRGPVSLDDVIDEVLADLEGEIEASDAQVTIERPLPAVLGDGSILTQVLANLLTNAMKFVAQGVQPHVHVWAEILEDHEWADGTEGPKLHPPHRKWVRLWVEDNGIGIEQHHIERIFRIFERLHGIEAYPGTGIGLAIVKKGVERLGGQVGVESEIGQGSRFWVELEAWSKD
jgi:PAS domain S-box-containing protein